MQRTSRRSNEEHACHGGIILRGYGENTSGIERWGKEKKRERREPTLRIGYAYAHRCVRMYVYANAPHGATRRPTQSGRTPSGEKEQKGRAKGRASRTGGKRRTSEKTLEEAKRRRNRGVGISDSNYLELQAADRTDPRSYFRRRDARSNFVPRFARLQTAWVILGQRIARYATFLTSDAFFFLYQRLQLSMRTKRTRVIRERVRVFLFLR